jgi:hypothetical protein
MEIIKKEIELDYDAGYEYRVMLPPIVSMKAIDIHSLPDIRRQSIAVYRFSYRHPYHRTYVYELEGVEVR